MSRRPDPTSFVLRGRWTCPFVLLLLLVAVWCTAPASEPSLPCDYSKFAEDETDAARLRALAFRMADWEAAESATSDQGLAVRAMLVPDALAYKVASRYLQLRQKGRGHAQAIGTIARSLPRWKRYEKKAIFRLRLSNEKFRLGRRDRRLFTLEKSLHEEGVIIRAKKKRIPASLGGKPPGLRLARLRIKKFWKTADGQTLKARSRDDPEGRDPGSIGREAMVSKPFDSLLLEDKPATVEILVSRSSVAKRSVDEFRLELHQWKRYEGPFAAQDDILDLNEKRPWNTIDSIHVNVSRPPLGMRISPEVRALVAEVRARVNIE